MAYPQDSNKQSTGAAARTADAPDVTPDSTPGPVFKPDTGRDAKGSGSHQSGEGGSGNESGSSGTEEAPLGT